MNKYTFIPLLLLAIMFARPCRCYRDLEMEGAIHDGYDKTHVGLSVMGLEIAAYRTHVTRGAPKVLIVGNIHGDETSGFDIVAALLAAAPRADLGIDLVLMPTMNPDGMYYEMRENAERIDLNRAFPDECNRTNATLTAESRAVMAFIASERPLVLLVYHGGTSVVVWGPEQNCTSAALSVETAVTPFQRKLMTTMADVYARTLHVGTVEGSVMYQVAGSLPAYAVPAYSQLALTIEVDRVKMPDDKREEYLVAEHLVALTDLLREIRAHVMHSTVIAAQFPTEHFADNDGYILYYEKSSQ